MPYAKSIIIFIIPVLFIFSPLGAQAAECNLSAQVRTLKEAETAPVSNYLESVKLELQARKELLSSTLDCVLTEVQELQDAAAGLANTKETAEIKNELLQKIEDARQYLERQKAQIPNLGIQGTKNVAREIGNWRNSSYVQLQNEANNLKIWNGNQSLFETAGKRLEEITKTVRLLKLLENDEIRSLYEKSEASLKIAGDLHRQALRNILEYRPAEDISSSLKTSLEALSQTYKNFLDLSQAVKKILPL
jgi:PP-loop superfamily ATP-utilizing enzyme